MVVISARLYSIQIRKMRSMDDHLPSLLQRLRKLIQLFAQRTWSWFTSVLHHRIAPNLAQLCIPARNWTYPPHEGRTFWDHVLLYKDFLREVDSADTIIFH
jgi:hypothetical protein